MKRKNRFLNTRPKFESWLPRLLAEWMRKMRLLSLVFLSSIKGRMKESTKACECVMKSCLHGCPVPRAIEVNIILSVSYSPSLTPTCSEKVETVGLKDL